MRKIVTWYMIAAMFILGIAPRVDAGFSPSEAIALASFDREADLDKIQAVLENKLVAQRLSDLGFSPDEIRARLSGLSDSQVHGLATQLDSLKVGGDALGAVIAVLVVVLLVILILKLMDKEIIIR